MSKKIILLVLVLGGLLAAPSAALAQEIHVKGITSFSGSAPFSSTITGNSEPKITCTATSATGGFDTGSTTTGKLTLDFTGCTAEYFGVKANCNTSGAASGTIASGGAFHLITISSGKPGILFTVTTTTIVCAGFSKTNVFGSVIGTITSPACGSSSKELTIKFQGTGGIQEHRGYTGFIYDLESQTGTSAPFIAGLTTHLTLSSSTLGTLECT